MSACYEVNDTLTRRFETEVLKTGNHLRQNVSKEQSSIRSKRHVFYLYRTSNMVSNRIIKKIYKMSFFDQDEKKKKNKELIKTILLNVKTIIKTVIQ